MVWIRFQIRNRIQNRKRNFSEVGTGTTTLHFWWQLSQIGNEIPFLSLQYNISYSRNLVWIWTGTSGSGTFVIKFQLNLMALLLGIRVLRVQQSWRGPARHPDPERLRDRGRQEAGGEGGRQDPEDPGRLPHGADKEDELHRSSCTGSSSSSCSGTRGREEGGGSRGRIISKI